MNQQFKFLARISCMTYNQASYIKDAMNGFCIQKTEFPFVCTIIDDASTDGEQDVIKKYLAENFELFDQSVVRNEGTKDYDIIIAQHRINKNCFFAVLFLKYNHYRIKKSKLEYIEEWSNTKYIAVCEGDDYWIDPLKLQKQVSFLEKNSDYVLIYTGSVVINQKSEKVIHRTPHHPSGNLTKKLIEKGNFIDTATVCYLNRDKEWLKIRDSMPFPLLMGDKPKWLFYSSIGKIKFLKENTTVYRLLPESKSHTKDAQKAMSFIDNSEQITKFFNKLYHVGVKESEIERKHRASKIREYAKLSKNDFIKHWKSYIKDYPYEIFNIRLGLIAILRIIFDTEV